MDRMLYIAMSGAKENFHGIALHGNNLANASTNRVITWNPAP